MLTITDLDNALVAQKDQFFEQLNKLDDAVKHGDFLRQAKELFAILSFVRLFWNAADYGYKWEELCKALQDRCSQRIEIISGVGSFRWKHDIGILVNLCREAGNKNWNERRPTY